MSYRSHTKPIFKIRAQFDEEQHTFPTHLNEVYKYEKRVTDHDEKNFHEKQRKVDEKLLEISKKIETLNNNIEKFEKLQKKLVEKVEFVKLIEKSLGYLALLNQIELYQNNKTLDDDVIDYLQQPNNLNDKLMFFWRYHQPTTFTKVNLCQNNMDNPKILELQAANKLCHVYGIKVSSLCHKENNDQQLSFQTYSNKNYWTILTINTDNTWVDRVKNFSITPYIKVNGKSVHNNQSLTSSYIKSISPNIFSSERKVIYIFFTFDNFFARLLRDESNQRYVFVLPFISNTSFIQILLRIETVGIQTKLNLKKSFNIHSFSNQPYFLPQFSKSNHHMDIETTLKSETRDAVIFSSYEKNKENIDAFLILSKEYNEKFTPLKVYPFYHHPYYTNTSPDIMFFDLNKSIYISEPIKIRNEPKGPLLVSTCIFIALNHVNNGNSGENFITLYNTEEKEIVDSFPTSDLGISLSSTKQMNSINSNKKNNELFRVEINFSKYSDEIKEVILFETLKYPTKPEYLLSSDQENYYHQTQQVSFDYNQLYKYENSSLTDSEIDVQRDNTYKIRTNNPEFSLHLNFSKYSTLNFRVYLTS
jgi:hypothetical protein